MNLITVDDIKRPELDVFAGLTENQLRIHKGLFLAESANVMMRAIEAGYEPVSMLVEEGRLEVEAKPVLDCIREIRGEDLASSLPIYIAPTEVIVNITGHNLVRGLWMAMRRQELTSVRDFLSGKKRIAVLIDITNPANVGAIFRSAAALGMDGVLLNHASVDPLTRRSSRASMGTVFQIPWAQETLEGSEGLKMICLLQKSGFKTVAMALTDDSIGIDSPEIRANGKLAVLLGTEGTGLPKDVINASDYRVKIPMHRGVDSLNVAVASAISFWEILK